MTNITFISKNIWKELAIQFSITASYHSILNEPVNNNITMFYYTDYPLLDTINTWVTFLIIPCQYLFAQKRDLTQAAETRSVKY